MITGVGDGTGAYTARRFAKAGYRIAMIARDKARLSSLENEIPDSKGFICDVSDLHLLQETCAKIKDTMKINVKPPPENERINALADIMAAVGPGISTPIPSYILTNTGTTLINIKIVTSIATENKTPG